MIEKFLICSNLSNRCRILCKEQNSVSSWIEGLKDGRNDAAHSLFERYFEQLITLARNKLKGFPTRVADEEDIAATVFEALCLGAKEGRFPNLRDRSDLWRLLVAITAKKVVDLKRRHLAAKRGGGRVRGDSALGAIDSVVAQQPNASDLLRIQEEWKRLLSILPDDELKQIAQLKLRGYTNDEVAASLDVVVRTIERKMQRIKLIWLAPED